MSVKGTVDNPFFIGTGSGSVDNPFFVGSDKGLVDNPFGNISGQAQSPYNIRYTIRSFADSVGVTDSAAFEGGSGRVFGNLSQISDVSLFSFGKFVNDTLSISQGVVIGFSKNLVDSALITESLAYNLQMQLATTADVEDLVGVPDGITYQYGMTKADAASIGEVFARTVVYKRAPAETLNTADASILATSKILEDSSGAVDAPILAIGKPFADGGDAGDASIMSIGLSKSEFLNAVDVFAPVYAFNRGHTDSSQTVSSPTLFFNKSLVDSKDVTDASIIAFSKNQNETISADELFTRIVTYNRGPVDSAQTTSFPAVLFNKILADTVFAIDSGGFFMGAGAEVGAGDSSQVADTSIIAFGKNANDPISAGESSTQVWAYNRPHTDTTDATESLAYNLAKVMVGDSASGVDSLAYNMALTAGGDSAAATEALGILTTLRPSDGVDAEDLVGVPDGITYQIAMTKADAASAGESLQRAWTAHRSFGDTGDASDVPVKSAGLAKSDSVTQSDAGQLFRLNYFESDYSVASFTAPYNFVETISLT